MHLAFEWSEFLPIVTNVVTGSERKIQTVPVFLVQTGVVGALKISNLPEELLNEPSCRIEIKLEGSMKCEVDTRIEDFSECRVVMERKILSMTQALNISGHYDRERGRRRYPFFFDLESWLKRDQQSCMQHRAMASRSNFTFLPPSLRHEIRSVAKGVPKPRGAGRVTYKVTARVVKGAEVITRLANPIHLMPTGQPVPPMCLADFSGEYQPRQRAALRGTLFKKAGDLSVLVTEPRQLSIRADCENARVELPIKLQLNQSSLESATGSSSYIEAEVNWRLRLSTFVSLKEQRGPATVKQAMSNPVTAYVKSAFQMRSSKMVWRSWAAIKSDEGTRLVESEQPLLLSVSRGDILTPTFWHSFVSRRYSIWLQVKVTRPATAKIEVEVPIQVGIDQECLGQYTKQLQEERRRNNLLVFETGEADELLPRYECA